MSGVKCLFSSGIVFPFAVWNVASQFNGIRDGLYTGPRLIPATHAPTALFPPVRAFRWPGTQSDEKKEADERHFDDEVDQEREQHILPAQRPAGQHQRQSR